MKDRGPLLWALVLAGVGLADIAVTLVVVWRWRGWRVESARGGPLESRNPGLRSGEGPRVDMGAACILYLLWCWSRLPRVVLPALAIMQSLVAAYGLRVLAWVRKHCPCDSIRAGR